MSCEPPGGRAAEATTAPADVAPVTDRAALTRDALAPVLLALAALFGLLTVVHLTAEPASTGRLLAVVSGVLAALFAAGGAACRLPLTRRWVLEHGDGVGLAAALLGSLHGFAVLLVTGAPSGVGPVLLFVVVVGALATDRRFAVVVIGVGLLEWTVVAVVHGFGRPWLLATIMVGCAVVLAQLLWTVRSRTANSLTAAQAEAFAATLTDEVTGLRNRRGLLVLGRAVLADDAAVERPVSLLFADVDDLKRTNDRHGHAAGDVLLRAAGRVLQSVARPGDVVARLGGDEFALLLREADAARAASLRDRIEADLAAAGVRASVGWAQARRGQGVEDLLDAADAAMYAVKQARRRARLVDERPPTLVPPAPRPPRPPAPDWPAADAEVEADLASMTRTGSRLFLLLAPVHLLVQPTSQGVPLAVLSVVLAVVFAAVHRVREDPAVRRRPGLVLAACLLLVCGDTVAFVAIIGEAWATTAVMLAVLAVGALLRSRLHVAVVALLAAGGWAAVAATHREAGEWRDNGMHLLAAVVLAGVLHLVQVRTVDRLVLARQRVQAVALTDELTGLANRRGFLAHGEPLVAQARRRGRPVSVVAVDLDGLKQVNDTLGHGAGDRLIAATADVLNRVAAPTDLCARVGGDEFTVLLDDCAPRDVPVRTRRIEQALRDAGIPASLGVAHLDDGAGSLEELVDRADAAMYATRRRRRDRRRRKREVQPR